MSELRVDNIVSQDGSAAPIYSKGLNIGAGQTLTNAGDYSVSGNSLFTELQLSRVVLFMVAVLLLVITLLYKDHCKLLKQVTSTLLVFLLVEH